MFVDTFFGYKKMIQKMDTTFNRWNSCRIGVFSMTFPSARKVASVGDGFIFFSAYIISADGFFFLDL